MSIIVLDGIKGEHPMKEILQDSIKEQGESLDYFKLEHMDIKACTNCGGCNYQTPGECVKKDDTEVIMRGLIKASKKIILSPVTFGGYNANTKKIIDKMGVLGLPIFEVRGGRLQHPNRYKTKDNKNKKQMSIYIGITNNTTDYEKESFKKSMGATHQLMNSPYKVIFIEHKESLDIVKNKLKNVLKEDCDGN